MISEYLLLSTFFALSIILLLCSMSLQLLNRMLTFKGADKGDFSKLKNRKLDTWYKLILILIGLVILLRFLFFFIYPQQALNFNFIPATSIHLLIIASVFLAFWLILWFFLLLKNKIKLEQKTVYLKTYFLLCMITALLDIILSLIIYFQNFHHHFSLQTINHTENLTAVAGSSPILIIQIILGLLLVLFYTLFILKRSVRILKQYYITVLIVMICTFLLLSTRGLHHLGWFEQSRYQLLLFSMSYAYLGWIFFALVLLSIFCHASSIIIYASLHKFENPIMYKQRVISFIKIGFVAQIAIILLSVVPDFLIWIYT